MHISGRALRYFDVIRRAGSIREAARRLHLASSAVNRQLLQLEEQIGSPLFERMPSGLKLTAAGEIFSRHVITVLQDEYRMANELDALKGLRRGELSITCVEGLNTTVLPTVLEHMLTRYPMLKITARSAGSQEAAKAVIEGDADVALVFSIERSEWLRQYAVGKFAVGAVVWPDHPLARNRTVTFADCARWPLILPGAELSLRAHLQPIILNHKKDLTVLMETGSVELAKRMALRKLGIAFQTRLGLEKELADGELVHIPLLAPAMIVSELGVYVRSGRTLPSALDAFIRAIDEEIERRAANDPFHSS